MANGGSAAQSDPTTGGPSDRAIVLRQMYVGCGLIAFGALLVGIYALIFKLSNIDLTTPTSGTNGPVGLTILGTIAVSTATAVIGAGAALLPGGAAASASNRILQSMPSGGPQQPDVVTGPAIAVPGAATVTVTGTVNPHSQVVAYLFRYGANKTATNPTLVPIASTPQQVQENIQLNKGDTYELIAKTGVGEVSGGLATY